MLSCKIPLLPYECVANETPRLFFDGCVSALSLIHILCVQIQEILRVSGTIEQHFCASEGYYITRPVAALCKPYQFRFFARLNIHAGIANCYAGRSRFYWRAYKPLTVLLLSPKSIAALRVITLHCVTHNNILRAQAVYPFAPS